MSINTAVLLNGMLDLGVIFAAAATMLLPFTLDRRKEEPAVYAFVTPLPDDLAG